MVEGPRLRELVGGVDRGRARGVIRDPCAVLGLSLLVVADRGVLGQHAHQLSHVRAEPLLDLRDIAASVLEHVVQESCRDDVVVEAALMQEIGDRDRMREVGVLPALGAAVRIRRELVRLLEKARALSV
jgi:hypothetical protein